LVQALMDPPCMVILLKGFQLPREIRFIPEQQVIQIFSTDGAYQSFDEGMGHRELVAVKRGWLEYRCAGLDFYVSQLNVPEEQRTTEWQQEYEKRIKPEEVELDNVIAQVKTLLVSCQNQ